MKSRGRLFRLIAGTPIVAGMATSPRAFASGHQPGGPLVFVAMLWSAWPLIAAWIVGLATLFGRRTVLKLVLGVASTLVCTISVLAFIEQESPWYLTTAALGLLVAGTHVVRYGIHLRGRATGGRTKETLRKWWRHL